MERNEAESRLKIITEGTFSSPQALRTLRRLAPYEVGRVSPSLTETKPDGTVWAYKCVVGSRPLPQVRRHR